MAQKNIKIRKYKKDDVYHYLVDNLPLEDILAYCVSLQDQINNRSDPTSFKTIQEVSSEKVLISDYEARKLEDFSDVIPLGASFEDALQYMPDNTWKPKNFFESPLSDFKHHPTGTDLNPANYDEDTVLVAKRPIGGSVGEEYLLAGQTGLITRFQDTHSMPPQHWGTQPYSMMQLGMRDRDPNNVYLDHGIWVGASTQYSPTHWNSRYEDVVDIINALGNMRIDPDNTVTHQEILTEEQVIGGGGTGGFGGGSTVITMADWLAAQDNIPLPTSNSAMLNSNNKQGEHIFSDGFMIKWMSGTSTTLDNTGDRSIKNITFTGTPFNEVLIVVGSLVKTSGGEADQTLMIDYWENTHVQYSQYVVGAGTAAGTGGTCYPILYALGIADDGNGNPR